MIKNLVIVESPAKAKTIESFLGKDFKVVSSYGHIRDLVKKDNGVEVENNFKPIYQIPAEKKQVVKELKKLAKEAETVWLATDEDREGEAIAWHLKEALDLPEKKIKRIVFHEITKEAIKHAIENPRKIDANLVNAQQARRILDRLVGFELSPILWRKVKPQLSAGRVQSVAVRLIVEREREIMNFKPQSQFRITGDFLLLSGKDKGKSFKAELSKKFKKEKEALEFLKKCKASEFTIASVEKKPFKKKPSPPFTTSTLQQEASRKLRFSVAKTMLIAQKLYEAGKITYMRTDSVNLSDFAIETAQKIIIKKYGKEYSHPQQYKTKTAGAQEAHEAIRPTDFSKETVSGSRDEKALYKLIRQRALASQMSDAEMERTTVKISISKSPEMFTAKGEVVKFDGFLKVYSESSDETNGEEIKEGLLPAMSEKDKVKPTSITATQRFTRPPARYTEASLVKKLEELGIGRPSTYAPTISTIQKRGYVVKGEVPGKERKYKVLTLTEKGEIEEEEKTEIYGADKGKLMPADIAMLVNDFLIDKFPEVMDYNFTAFVENELDDIAKGKLKWDKMLKEFYSPFHNKVTHTIENSERVSGEKFLGTDPKTGKHVSVRMARFGPVVQLTNPDDPDEKPQYAGLRHGQRMETITLEEALELFKLPRTLGKFEDEEVVVAIGRFGPYVKHKNKFYSLGKNHDPYSISLEEAIQVIEAKRKADAEKTIKTFEEDDSIKILKGRWGPYLKAGKMNVKIPKEMVPEKLTYAECLELIEEAKKKKKK
jgi:DNA topoisomerase-1